MTSPRPSRRREAAGAEVVVPPMPVADLGTQAVLVDPTGAPSGPGRPAPSRASPSSTSGRPGLVRAAHPRSPRGVAFYRDVFRWETDRSATATSSATRTMRNPGGDGELAGVMDASSFLPEGVGSHWSIYWQVDDAAAAAAKAAALGGTIVMEAYDTPYGILATVTDPAGAEFKLRTPSKG